MEYPDIGESYDTHNGQHVIVESSGMTHSTVRTSNGSTKVISNLQLGAMYPMRRF